MSDFAKRGDAGQCPKDVPGKNKDKLPVASPSKVSKHRKPRSSKTKNEKPTRPLSAYNMFFKEERVKWLAETEDKDAETDDKAKNKFTQLGYEMGQRWKKLTPEEKAKYEKLAKEDVKRYQKEMENWQETETSPKGVNGLKSPQKPEKDAKEEVQKVERAPQSSVESQRARLLTSGQSPALGAQLGAMGVDPQELMIQQLLASQHGAGLGQQMNAQIPSLAAQLSDREAILRQLQLQELASRQTAQLSQLFGGGNQFMGPSGFPGSGNFLQGLSGANGHATQSMSGLEQQLLIQRLRENELRSQIASMERGLAAPQFQFQSLPGQGNVPLSNLDLLAMHATSQPGNIQQGSIPATDSEVLANMSVREKLQLLMQLNQQGY